MRAGVCIASVAFVLVACGAFESSSDDPPAVGTPDAGQTGLVDAAGAGLTEAGAESGAVVDAAGCNLKTLTGLVDGDTGLVDCGATSYGTKDFIYLGLDGGRGLGIFRFKFLDEAIGQIASLKIHSIVLHLTANIHCEDCGPTGTPAFAGTIKAHVARNDWTEGVKGSYGGADACRKSDGNPGIGWGSKGDLPSLATYISSTGNDYDQPSSNATITDNQSEVDIPISDLGPRGQQGLVTDKMISFFLEMPDGGQFLAATKDSALAAPLLAITYCE